MPDFLFLMHAMPPGLRESGDWAAYLDRLAATGTLRGGSSLGAVTLAGTTAPLPTPHPLTGYLLVTADDLGAAQSLLIGNPVWQGGGVVEIRELVRDDDVP